MTARIGAAARVAAAGTEIVAVNPESGPPRSRAISTKRSLCPSTLALRARCRPLERMGEHPVEPRTGGNGRINPSPRTGHLVESSRRPALGNVKPWTMESRLVSCARNMAASSWRHSDLWRASPASRFLRVLSMGALSATAAPVSADDFAVMLASFRVATSDAEEILLSLSDVFVTLMQRDERGQRIVVVTTTPGLLSLSLFTPPLMRERLRRGNGLAG